MRKATSIFVFALTVSIVTNMVLVYRLVDTAKRIDDMEFQGVYQREALATGLAAMQAFLIGKQRQEAIAFFDSTNADYYNKAENIETSGYDLAIKGEKVSSITPLGW